MKLRSCNSYSKIGVWHVVGWDQYYTAWADAAIFTKEDILQNDRIQLYTTHQPQMPKWFENCCAYTACDKQSLKQDTAFNQIAITAGN